jgi:hypothetical protein
LAAGRPRGRAMASSPSLDHVKLAEARKTGSHAPGRKRGRQARPSAIG